MVGVIGPLRARVAREPRTIARSIEPAPVNVEHGKRREGDAVEASDVDAPEVRRRARPPEGKDPARRAEVVLRRPRVPLIHRELVERGPEVEAALLDPMGQRTALPADAAVTQADVIEIDVDLDLELDLPAMA